MFNVFPEFAGFQDDSDHAYHVRCPCTTADCHMCQHVHHHKSRWRAANALIEIHKHIMYIGLWYCESERLHEQLSLANRFLVCPVQEGSGQEMDVIRKWTVRLEQHVRLAVMMEVR